ncbi:hypothetical protein [Rothia nasimurium]|uniref:hypothetical protein n=1 Tax=Rothia nasimurium TaxID=85336 RepID=UPI001F22C79B|nr:hypothetical protein [Rothia nasimurium]
MTQPSQNRRDFDEWDAVFEDSDPTRVLDPRTHQQEYTRGAPGEAEHSGVQPTQDAPLTASRYGRVEPVAAQSTPEPLPQTASPQLYREEQLPSVSPAPPAPGPGSRRLQYSRIQFIPAFAGVLVASALYGGALPLLRSLFTLLGLSHYSGITETVLAATSASTQAQALPWAIGVGLLLLTAFGFGGYTASRMAVLAPSKQALGVLGMAALGVLLATLLTWATSSMSSPLAPRVALQPLLGPDLAVGTLVTLALAVLALIGALIGAAAGSRYHKAISLTG